jgi:ligand-binding sensor domain-containing protein
MKIAIMAFVVYLSTIIFAMKTLFSLLIFLLFTIFASAQSSQAWTGYFSYTGIKDIAQSDTKVFAASENALFSHDQATNLIKTTTTVNGLSGQTISAVYFSTAFNRTIIGYENGLVTVINPDGSIVKVVDIINKQIPPNIKRVNHFMEHDGIIYISCDFGICQYNLATLQFGDTYFIGTTTAEIIVNQTAVFNGFIYAATQDNGIKRADINNPSLVDATQWTQVIAGNWKGIETFGPELIAVTTSGQLNRYNGAAFVSFSQLTQPPLDLRSAEDYLIVTTAGRVTLFNQTLAIVSQTNAVSIPDVSAQFSCATVKNQSIYIGTVANGLFRTEVINNSTFENLTPAGPIQNEVFSLNATTENLWLTYGGYPLNYDPNLRTLGISKYNPDSGWKNIPYDEVHAPGKQAFDLVRLTINPKNTDQFYVSSYFSGLLKFENEQLVAQYDQSNTNNGLESVVVPGSPGYISVRIEQSAFDSAGNLWMTNGLVQDGMKELKANGSWQSYDLEPIIDSFFDDRWGRMVIDRNDVKWFATYANGVVGFSENGPSYKKITMGSDAGNLPFQDVRALAIDKSNQLWIGTAKGLRVLSSVDSFQNEGQLTSNPVIILDDDGVAQELFYEQYITDIAVDGANNKWIGTADSGIFMVSPNGQETFHHFTINDSPLPSNGILDIEINGATGEVFIATQKGLVSFGGNATDAKGDLNNVIVYPNPVRPEFVGTVKITNLLDNANVKIADIAGNLVYEANSVGGTIEWDTTAFGKYRVASGVYMIFISAEDGIETKVKKVMIIR